MRIALHLLCSFILGVLLMLVGSLLFDAMNWPMFHSWAIWHGSIVIALPVCWGLVFGLMFLIPWFRAGWPDPPS
jgi:hypothetical protein